MNSLTKKTMKNRKTIVSLVSGLLVLASLSGCSPSNTPNNTNSSTSTNSANSVDTNSNTNTASKSIDICQIVTAADIKNLTGKDVTKNDDFLNNSTANGCMYSTAEGKSINIIVTVYPDADTAKSYYEKTRQMVGEGSTTVTGVGNDGFLNSYSIVTQLVTIEGKNYLTISNTIGGKVDQEKILKTVATMLFKKLQ